MHARTPRAGCRSGTRGRRSWAGPGPGSRRGPPLTTHAYRQEDPRPIRAEADPGAEAAPIMIESRVFISGLPPRAHIRARPLWPATRRANPECPESGLHSVWPDALITPVDVSVLSRVGLGLQPAPSRRQIPKTQVLLRVGGVASGHAVPLFDPPPPRPRSLDIRRVLGYPPGPPCPWRVGLRTAPDDSYSDDRYPGVPHPFFAGYLFRPTRRQGRAWPSWRGSAARDDTEGRTCARGAARVRKGELGLWPLGGWVPPGRLAAPAGPPADPTGCVRRVAGQHHMLSDRRGRPLGLRLTGGTPRQHPSSGTGGTLDGGAPVLSDRPPGL